MQKNIYLDGRRVFKTASCPMCGATRRYAASGECVDCGLSATRVARQAAAMPAAYVEYESAVDPLTDELTEQATE